MNVMDILKSYADRPTDTHTDFDEVVGQVPPETLGSGIAAALRSDQTPDFGTMAASLFGGSNPQQRAGMLGQLVRTLGPAVIAGMANGGLGKILGGLGAAGRQNAEISTADASTVSADQVRDLAREAEKSDHTVMDRIGEYYAQHPEVVKVLGGAALAIALGQMAQRMKR